LWWVLIASVVVTAFVDRLPYCTGTGDSDDVYGYVGRRPDGTIVVSFRGTNPLDIQDWVSVLAVIIGNWQARALQFRNRDA
jgi:hypothetical protein